MQDARFLLGGTDTRGEANRRRSSWEDASTKLAARDNAVLVTITTGRPRRRVLRTINCVRTKPFSRSDHRERATSRGNYAGGHSPSVALSLFISRAPTPRPIVRGCFFWILHCPTIRAHLVLHSESDRKTTYPTTPIRDSSGLLLVIANRGR